MLEESIHIVGGGTGVWVGVCVINNIIVISGDEASGTGRGGGVIWGMKPLHQIFSVEWSAPKQKFLPPPMVLRSLISAYISEFRNMMNV